MKYGAYSGFYIHKLGGLPYINVDEELIEVDNKVLELDSRVRLIDADEKTLAIGPKEVAGKLETGMKVDLTEKDGIVTEIKIEKEKEPEDPDPEGPGEEVTATYSVGPNLFGNYAITVTLSEEATAEDVTSVKVNGAEVTAFSVEGKTVKVVGPSPIDVKLVIKGVTVTAEAE